MLAKQCHINKTRMPETMLMLSKPKNPKIDAKKQN